MKCPSLQSCKLSRPTNQSGEGTIFVIADTCKDEDGGGGDDHDEDDGIYRACLSLYCQICHSIHLTRQNSTMCPKY